jgi:Retroviral aspartyl protease
MCKYRTRHVNIVHASYSPYNSVTSASRSTNVNNKVMNDVTQPCSSMHTMQMDDNDCSLDVVELLLLSEEHERSSNSNDLTSRGRDSLDHEVARLICVEDRSTLSLEQCFDNNKLQEIMETHTNIPTGIIELDIAGRVVKSIIDSGADISVINAKDIDINLLLKSATTAVNLQSVFGEAIRADLCPIS